MFSVWRATHMYTTHTFVHTSLYTLFVFVRYGVAISPCLSYALVTDNKDNRVLTLSLSTGEVSDTDIPTSRVGRQAGGGGFKGAWGIAFVPGSNDVIVSCYGTNSLR